MKTCYIVGAGDFFEKSLPVKEGDYVIAADGGYEHLLKIGIIPDVILGDFDSIDPNIYKNISGTGNLRDKIIEFPRQKDETDMMLAVRHGMEKGYGFFQIFGWGGGRVSHTFANMQLITYIFQMGAEGALIDRETLVTAVKNAEISFGKDQKGYISLLSLNDVSEGITIKGLKYEIENASLENYTTVGVSNEFIGKENSIRVENGLLAIIIENL